MVVLKRFKNLPYGQAQVQARSIVVVQTARLCHAERGCLFARLSSCNLPAECIHTCSFAQTTTQQCNQVATFQSRYHVRVSSGDKLSFHTCIWP